MKIKRLFLILIVLLLFTGISKVQANSDDVIYFPDKNLASALCRIYYCEGPITKKMAHDLSNKEGYISFTSDEISDLEGLQYFDGLTSVSFYNCKLTNLKPLSKLPKLNSLNILDNSIRGKELENILNNTGNIKGLKCFGCYNNDIEDISFLNNIGNVSKYTELDLSFNKIKDISVLRKCKKLSRLNLENNRIVDVTPIKNLRQKYFDLYIHDNCIIDLKPIKPLFDSMFTGRCGAELLDRFDFYRNPVNIIYQNKEVQFPNITVYYQYQAYAEAIPLIKLFGGSAEYNKDTGTLMCKIYGKELIMKDFSNIYTINGTDKIMTYEMRRMQYDIPYVPVKDLCIILGLNYNILKERTLYTGDGEEAYYPPEVVEISECEISAKTGDYKYIIKDNQAGIIKHLGTETNVIIPSQINGFPVTYIEDGAFTNDIYLVSVEIPDTVIRIGTSWGEEGVFTGCEKLISVKINEGKENAYIGSNAFLGCSQLSSINIPGNYKVIYDNAFNNCTSLKAITISEGVERIGAGAFAGDDALKSIIIPSTMKAIGYEYDDAITTDPYYINQTGVFSSCKGLNQVDIVEGKENAYIGANTFSDCIRLETVIIPGNYKAIYNNAFTNCVKLKSIVYEKSSLYDYAYQIIDENVFEGCIRLEEVSLPETLKTIGDEAFIGCASLKDFIIPEGVIEIGRGAFIDNEALTSVTIPSTIKSIGLPENDSFSAGSTFYGCTNLINVTIKEGKQDATISDFTFKGCVKLEKIIIPGNYISIGKEAFSDCTALKSVIYKNNSNSFTKQKILSNAFQGCKSLVAISLPSTLTLLEYNAFNQCTNLKTVIIPTGVNQLNIKDFVFDTCPSLTSVYVGDNVRCSDNSFSLSYSNAKIYTHNNTVKEIVKSEELKVYSPSKDYANGIVLFGSIDIIGTREVGSILTANIDAVAPNNATVTYEWNIDGSIVSTESTYKIKNEDNGKSIIITVTGTNEYTGSLTKKIKVEKSNAIRYDGYYYSFDESNNTLDIFRFYPSGKVINEVITLDDSRKFTDINQRDKFFEELEKWFNYKYKSGFGYFETNYNNIYFNVKYYDNEYMSGEVENIGLIKTNSLDLIVISHRTDYSGNIVYTFLHR